MFTISNLNIGSWWTLSRNKILHFSLNCSLNPKLSKVFEKISSHWVNASTSFRNQKQQQIIHVYDTFLPPWDSFKISKKCIKRQGLCTKANLGKKIIINNFINILIKNEYFECNTQWYKHLKPTCTWHKQLDLQKINCFSNSLVNKHTTVS